MRFSIAARWDLYVLTTKDGASDGLPSVGRKESPVMNCCCTYDNLFRSSIVMLSLFHRGAHKTP
jgi:hypothetical protein